jgi:hypothetical protein
MLFDAGVALDGQLVNGKPAMGSERVDVLGSGGVS